MIAVVGDLVVGDVVIVGAALDDDALAAVADIRAAGGGADVVVGDGVVVGGVDGDVVAVDGVGAVEGDAVQGVVADDVPVNDVVARPGRHQDAGVVGAGGAGGSDADVAVAHLVVVAAQGDAEVVADIADNYHPLDDPVVAGDAQAAVKPAGARVGEEGGGVNDGARRAGPAVALDDGRAGVTHQAGEGAIQGDGVVGVEGDGDGGGGGVVVRLDEGVA